MKVRLGIRIFKMCTQPALECSNFHQENCEWEIVPSSLNVWKASHLLGSPVSSSHSPVYLPVSRLQHLLKILLMGDPHA